MKEARFCKRCNKNQEIEVGPGTKIHTGRLICSVCGCFITWIPKAAASNYDIPGIKKEEEKQPERPKQKRLF